MGYAGGGSADHPTYTSIGDHIETVLVEFDPEIVSYRQLLEIFRSLHDPTRRPWARQYASALMPLGGGQLREATEFLSQLEQELGQLQTLVLPDARFYSAEDYHQKYYLQQHPVIFRSLSRSYQTFDQLVDSPLAARINGYLGGFGSIADLTGEIEQLGLSQEAAGALLEAVRLLSRP